MVSIAIKSGADIIGWRSFFKNLFINKKIFKPSVLSTIDKLGKENVSKQIRDKLGSDLTNIEIAVLLKVYAADGKKTLKELLKNSEGKTDKKYYETHKKLITKKILIENGLELTQKVKKTITQILYPNEKERI